MYPMKWPLGLTGIIVLLSSLTAPAGAETISILTWRCDEESSQIVVRGDIRNSSASVQNPVVVALFKSIKEETIANSKGLAVLSPLPAGQTSPLELLTRNRRDIASCELMLQDPVTGKILAHAKQTLPIDLPDRLGDAEKGQGIFNGKGSCVACHGRMGRIDETPDYLKEKLAELNPQPSNLRDSKALKLKSDKQRFRAVKYGLPGTAMLPMTQITDEEIIDILAYLRSLREDSK